METVESTSLASDEVSIGNGNMDVKKVKRHPKLGHRLALCNIEKMFAGQNSTRQLPLLSILDNLLLFHGVNAEN